MFSVTQQQASKQWEAITPSLREALFSDVNADLVWNFCQTEHLSKEISYQVAELSGYVLFGFIRPEELSGELIDSLSLSPELAQKISDEINVKVFAPLRADIDKAYATASGKEVDSFGPKIIQNISSVTASVSTPPIPPQSLSGMGWSKMKPLGPAIVSSVPPPASLKTILNSIPKPPSPPKSSMGEFERIKSSITPPVPLVPTHIPAPVMLQQEIPVANATQKNADFHIAKSSESAQMEFSKAKEQIKVMPAVIEFNRNAPANTKTSTVPLPLSAPNHAGAINYTEFKSSLASIPIMDSGARKVTEITSAAPVPVPTPATPTISPKPPTPPMPPVINKTSIQTPPQPLAQKVIVQNFLEKPLK
jgi:hypothetical protein